MPVNKGLLLSAAMANGLNAFLDAREKGDLQRQRQAVSQISEQIKAAQLQNLYGVGRQQDIDYQLSGEQYPHLVRGSKADADYKASRATEQGISTDVARETKGPRISQAASESDKAAQDALTAAVNREIEESKRTLQKFVTSVKTLGYSDANAMIEDYDDPKTTEFKKAGMRQSMGIETDAELRELTDTVAHGLAQKDMAVKDAQAAYLKAGADVRAQQAAWYEMRAKSADVITPTDVEILIGAGVDSADIPNKYSELNYSQMQFLIEADTGPYKFRQVTTKGGGVGMVRENPDGTLELVLITKSDQYLREQFKSEVGQEPLDASVDDGSEAVELAPDADEQSPDFRLELSLRKEFRSIPVVEMFGTIDMLYDSALAAFRVGSEGGKQTFVDQALIMLFNKMLDYKSVVRHSEYIRTQTDMDIRSRIKSMTKKILDGGVLDAKNRQALIKMCAEFRTVARDRYVAERGELDSMVDSMNDRVGRVMFSADDIAGRRGLPSETIILGRSGGNREEQIRSDAEGEFGAPTRSR